MRDRKSKPDRRQARLPGFSLIELLVVIAVIAILAALVLSTAGFVQRKAAMARAQAEIEALSAALESYKADNGAYPSGTNTANTSTGTNSFLYQALSAQETNGNTTKVYFGFNSRMLSPTNYTASNNIIDPFGNAYGYQCPGNTNRNGTNFFDLWSSAGSTNTNAWIKNW